MTAKRSICASPLSATVSLALIALCVNQAHESLTADQKTSIKYRTAAIFLILALVDSRQVLNSNSCKANTAAVIVRRILPTNFSPTCEVSGAIAGSSHRLVQCVSRSVGEPPH